jgi:hypothetical protein
MARVSMLVRRPCTALTVNARRRVRFRQAIAAFQRHLAERDDRSASATPRIPEQDAEQQLDEMTTAGRDRRRGVRSAGSKYIASRNRNGEVDADEPSVGPPIEKATRRSGPEIIAPRFGMKASIADTSQQLASVLMIDRPMKINALRSMQDSSPTIQRRSMCHRRNGMDRRPGVHRRQPFEAAFIKPRIGRDIKCR